MASDYINRVVLKGRPSKKPEIRYLPVSGDAVANFSLATNYGDHVEWHSIVAYKAMAERAVTFDAGDMVYIEGRIATREFQTAEDKTLGRKPRKVTEIIVETCNLVQKKGANEPQEQQQIQSSRLANSGRPATLTPPDEAEESSFVPGYL